jgi:hypothetical protein
MPRIAPLILLVACVSWLALPPGPGLAEEGGTKPAAPGEVLAGMSWLAGSWSGAMWGGTFHAYYSTPEGGKVLSFSHLERGGKRAFHEFEVFYAAGEAVHLQPYPGGRPAGGFVLASHDAKARKAVFENPKKDFPTRIVYQRVSETRLVITLSDPHGGSDKVETFTLDRAK